MTVPGPGGRARGLSLKHIAMVQWIADRCHSRLDQYGSLGFSIVVMEAVLADAFRMHWKKVRRNISWLEWMGVLAIVERGGIHKPSGKRMAHVYAVPGQLGCLEGYQYRSKLGGGKQGGAYEYCTPTTAPFPIDKTWQNTAGFRGEHFATPN